MVQMRNFLGILILIVGCTSQEHADMIIHNASIATMNEMQPEAQAIAISEGKIQALGSDEEILELKGDGTKLINANGNFVMPGFIEGHGHFSGLGQSLQNLNFLRSRNWDEIVEEVGDKAKEMKEGDWIVGRGWHQEKWNKTPAQNVHGYPHHDELSAVSPNNPVILFHASGHALFGNQAAMRKAGISKETQSPSGGEIVRDRDGKAIGVFEERAQNLIRGPYQEYLAQLSMEEKLEVWQEGIKLAEEECLKKGVTSFQDAGSSFEMIDRYRDLAEDGELDLRLWVMIRHSSHQMEGKLGGFPWIGVGDNFLTVRAIKSEVDGALGSFGAWLLEPYDDKPDFYGQNTTEISEVETIAKQAHDAGLQLCVHAIGDRANREVLDIMEEFYAEIEEPDLRWRIEHSQHLHPDDIPRFGELGIIASMQGIHCTSDAPFVEKRLGYERARFGAYPWRTLLETGAIVTNGTDAPVEDVDPLESYFASVTRQRLDNGFEFYREQAMSRYEALKSYTLDVAYSGFEEDLKGSLQVGKLADVVILSQNLLTCPDDAIMDTDVLYTIVGGEVKYAL